MAENARPDFGRAGKVTIRTSKVAVGVNLGEGQYLFYRLRVAGAQPLFSWACEHGPRLKAADFPGHPKQVYEWTWGRESPGLKDNDDDVYSVGMLFTAATKYTLFVELRGRNDEPIKTLKDVDLESQAPQDSFTSALRIFVD